MSHTSLCPVTVTSCPLSRRHASFTTANASGRISSRTPASSSLYFSSSLLISRVKSSRSCGSVATRLRARIDSISVRVASVRLAMVALNSSVLPLSASVESDSSPA